MVTTIMILVTVAAQSRLNCGKNLVGGIGRPEQKILMDHSMPNRFRSQLDRYVNVYSYFSTFKFFAELLFLANIGTVYVV